MFTLYPKKCTFSASICFKIGSGWKSKPSFLLKLPLNFRKPPLIAKTSSPLWSFMVWCEPASQILTQTVSQSSEYRAIAEATTRPWTGLGLALSVSPDFWKQSSRSNYQSFTKLVAPLSVRGVCLNTEGFERTSPPENLHVHLETQPQSQVTLRHLYGCE